MLFLVLGVKGYSFSPFALKSISRRSASGAFLYRAEECDSGYLGSSGVDNGRCSGAELLSISGFVWTMVVGVLSVDGTVGSSEGCASSVCVILSRFRGRYPRSSTMLRLGGFM